jgi:hypothetical protein
MGRPYRIKELGPKAEMLLAQLKAKGLGVHKIASEMSEILGVAISAKAVQTHLREFGKGAIVQSIGPRNAQVLEKQNYESSLLEVTEQLKKANEDIDYARAKVMEKIERLDLTEDKQVLIMQSLVSQLTSLSKELRSQWEYVKKFHEQVFGSGNVTYNMDVIQIANFVDKRLTELEQEGMIQFTEKGKKEYKSDEF